MYCINTSTVGISPIMCCLSEPTCKLMTSLWAQIDIIEGTTTNGDIHDYSDDPRAQRVICRRQLWTSFCFRSQCTPIDVQATVVGRHHEVGVGHCKQKRRLTEGEKRGLPSIFLAFTIFHRGWQPCSTYHAASPRHRHNPPAEAKPNS